MALYGNIVTVQYETAPKLLRAYVYREPVVIWIVIPLVISEGGHMLQVTNHYSELSRSYHIPLLLVQSSLSTAGCPRLPTVSSG